MKKMYFLLACVCLHFTALAQTDTTAEKNSENRRDTIRIGNMIIIRKKGQNKNSDTEIVHTERKKAVRQMFQQTGGSLTWVLIITQTIPTTLRLQRNNLHQGPPKTGSTCAMASRLMLISGFLCSV